MFKTIFPISIIIALRFLGLFIVLPVLSVYAFELEGANEILVGASLGIYAISQMVMQIPFGALSDKFGRKEALFVGTVIFMAGSLVCAYADSIYALFIGRFVQGMGAVGAVGSALISDLTKEETRAKAMAFMGIIISLSFALSMTLGPIIGGYFGIDKLFLFTAFLAFLSLFLLFTIKNPPKIQSVDERKKINYSKLLKDENLCRMNITNFLQKMLMTMTFMSIPIIMTRQFLWDKKELWYIYLPAMIFGMFAMLPSVIVGEKMKKSKEMLCVGILFFALSYFFMGYAKDARFFIVGVTLFFTGFNIHEPLMQSLTSKYAKVKSRGVTLGVFNFFGYFGTFCGGIVGGVFLQHYEIMQIFWIVFFTCIVWLFLILTLKNPAFFQNIYIPLSQVKQDYTQYLENTIGIAEWYISDNTLVVKFNTKIADKSDILANLKYEL
ncbi:MAG: MFS transporter [Campylobacteraceae bacterium]|jgi:predicted MFS family arabinose efflux permease|nr:MFS transporter [Campylobacteraceae bacterium]